MPLGKPETFMSTFQMARGLDDRSAQPLSREPKFSVGQKCLNKKYCRGSFIKSGINEYLQFCTLHSFIAVITSYSEIRLGTEKTLPLEAHASSPLGCSFVFVWSTASPPPPKYFVSSGHSFLKSDLGRLLLYSSLVLLAF